MDPDPLSMVTLVFAFFLVAFTAGAEYALANLSRRDIRRRSEEGDIPAKRLEALLVHTNQALLAIVLLRTLGIVLAGLAAVRSRPMGGGALATALLILFLWFALALTQVVARALVRPRQEAFLLRSSAFLNIVVPLLSPVSALLRGVAHLFGDEETETAEEGLFLGEDSLRLIMNARQEEDSIEDSEREMIASILDMEETVAREVMVPRIDMVALDVETKLHAAVDVIIQAGHSRIPIYEGNIDHIVGLLYAKDLLTCVQTGRLDRPIRELLRVPYFVPGTKKLKALFGEMQKQRTHVAIVVDEYGGTAGLVTIEDILEEIVGDIQDEYDSVEDEYVQFVGGTGYLINARLDVYTLADLLHIELPDDNVDTLGGLLFGLLGRVPEQGESVNYGGWLFTVIAVDGRRIEQVRVEPVAQPAAPDVAEPQVERDDAADHRPRLRFLSL